MSRRKHERGICQHCGQERALNSMGNVFIHRNQKWVRCPGSGRPPASVMVGRRERHLRKEGLIP